MSDAWFDAARADDAVRLEQLLAGDGALLAAIGGDDGATALHVATREGAVAAAGFLIDAGADLEARTCHGRTALHDAIELSSPVESLLLERGAFVDVCAAAILRRTERLAELLDADPALANDRSTGLSPLGWAAYGDAVPTARLLIERGARMDDHELHCAANVGHVDVARVLLDAGAGADVVDERVGRAPLHTAVVCPYGFDPAPFVRLLLDRGADPDRPDARGRRPVELARAAAAERKARGQEAPWLTVVALLEERSAR